MAVALDSRKIAFIATNTEGKRSLWIRPLDSLSAQRLDKTEGAGFPFWSPDSKSIAFFAGGKLKRIAVSGWSLQTLCDGFDGGAWSTEGVIVFSPKPVPGCCTACAQRAEYPHR